MPLGRPYRAEPALAFATQGVALGLTIQAFQGGGPYTEATSEREKMYKLQGATEQPDSAGLIGFFKAISSSESQKSGQGEFRANLLRHHSRLAGRTVPHCPC